MRERCFQCLAGACFFIVARFVSAGEIPSVEVFFDNDNPGLRVAGEEMMPASAESRPRVRSVRLADSYRNHNEEENEKQLEIPPEVDPYAGETRKFSDGSVEVAETQVDQEHRRIAQKFAWGQVCVTYRPTANGLVLEVETMNSSDLVIEQIVFDLLRLRLPIAGGKYPPSRWNKYPEQRSKPVRLEAGKRYYIEALMKEQGGGDNLSVAWEGPGIAQEVIPGAYLAPPDAPDKRGAILREWWHGIPGAKISDLTAAPAFQGKPAGQELVKSFDAPVDWAENYGQRMRGYLYPAKTGDYVFWIASDDEGELWLSPDDKPENRVKIAQVPGWVGTGEEPAIVSSQPDWAYDVWNIGAPLVIKREHQRGMLVAASPEPGGPLHYRFAREDGETIVQVLAGDADGGAERYDGKWNCRPIKPKAVDRFTLSLYFAPAGADPIALAEPAFFAFAQKHPFSLRWPDRRPIGAIHLADNRTDEKNPRGWRHASSVPDAWDIRQAGSHEKFREHLLAGAQRIIQVARLTGMQGIIVWQPEGQQHPGAYYGEPRIVPWLAPEMDKAADEFFAIIRAAGLRTGICIRPNIFAPLTADGKKVVPWKEMQTIGARDWLTKTDEVFKVEGSPFAPDEAQSPVARLDAKIRYAKKRWGCTLFYIDTNYFWRPRNRSKEGWDWRGPMLRSEVFEELHRRHPDILLVPEHEYIQYWSATAPYLQPPNYGTITPSDVRAAYPEAFSVMCADPGDAALAPQREIYLNAVLAGDIFMFNGWYGGQSVADFYREAAGRAPYRLRLAKGGAWKLERRRSEAAGAPFAAISRGNGLDELIASLQGEVKGSSPVASRRIWLIHGKDTQPAEIEAAVAAIGKSEGIVAWSSAEETP